MNIFYLSNDPSECAKSLGDKHCVKMVLETAQMLCTAHRMLSEMSQIEMDDLGFYRPSHPNHPVCLWVRSSGDSYDWTCHLWNHMLDEFHFRRGKIHASQRLLDCKMPRPPALSGEDCKPIPLCVPEDCKMENNPVESYRNYYMHKWRDGIVEYNWGREMPRWLQDRIALEA